MARGWESKSVEAQQEDVAEERRRLKTIPISTQAWEIAAKRRHLELSLKRTREELAGTEHLRRRTQLESAERFLQRELEKLPKP